MNLKNIRIQTYLYRISPPPAYIVIPLHVALGSSVRAQVVHRRSLVATFAVEFRIVNGVDALLAAAEPVDAADDVRAAKDRDSVICHR